MWNSRKRHPIWIPSVRRPTGGVSSAPDPLVLSRHTRPRIKGSTHHGDPNSYELSVTDFRKRGPYKTICKWGHDLTLPGAVRYNKWGRSDGCYECKKERQRRYYATDPALRERVSAYSKARYRRLKERGQI